MQQLSKTKTVLYHLYPGVLICICFISMALLFQQYWWPPQLSLLIAIAVAAVPLLLLHLKKARRAENKKTILELNGLQNKLPNRLLIIYVAVLVVSSFLIWGITQPWNEIIVRKLFSWLPDWYRVQDFSGYSRQVIVITLVLNLVLNGMLAPVVEEFYFRGYLLPRMAAWGKWAFLANAVLFSLYHLWQPDIWLTLIISLLPMTYLVWKTKDLRIGIYTHCLINIIGALLTFGLLLK